MKKHILIVDDEYEVSQAVEGILEDEGFSVKTCGDGLEAQTYLKDHVPNLIISDVMMPYCNGYQLLEFIRKQETLGKVPVILMSAASLRSDGPKPDKYMKKPFDLDTLLTTVEKVIGKA